MARSRKNKQYRDPGRVKTVYLNEEKVLPGTFHPLRVIVQGCVNMPGPSSLLLVCISSEGPLGPRARRKFYSLEAGYEDNGMAFWSLGYCEGNWSSVEQARRGVSDTTSQREARLWLLHPSRDACFWFWKLVSSWHCSIEFFKISWPPVKPRSGLILTL